MVGISRYASLVSLSPEQYIWHELGCRNYWTDGIVDTRSPSVLIGVLTCLPRLMNAIFPVEPTIIMPIKWDWNSERWYVSTRQLALYLGSMDSNLLRSRSLAHLTGATRCSVSTVYREDIVLESCIRRGRRDYALSFLIIPWNSGGCSWTREDEVFQTNAQYSKIQLINEHILLQFIYFR